MGKVQKTTRKAAEISALVWKMWLWEHKSRSEVVKTLGITKSEFKKITGK